MNFLTRLIDRHRVARHRERCRIEACQRLADEVERRANSPEIISFRVRREAALRHYRGEGA